MPVGSPGEDEDQHSDTLSGSYMYTSCEPETPKTGRSCRTWPKGPANQERRCGPSA